MNFRRGLVLFPVLVFSFFTIASAQQADGINYDEAKVGDHTLPDVLKAADGRTIKTANAWEQIRRPQILQLYEQHVFGKMPAKPKGMHFRINSLNEAAVNGKAVCKQVSVFFCLAKVDPQWTFCCTCPRAQKDRCLFLQG